MALFSCSQHNKKSIQLLDSSFQLLTVIWIPEIEECMQAASQLDSQDSLKIFSSCHDRRHDASIQHGSTGLEYYLCVHVLKVNFDVNLVINESKKRATACHKSI